MMEESQTVEGKKECDANKETSYFVVAEEKFKAKKYT